MLRQPREQSWLPNEQGYAAADTGFDQPSVPASDSASVFCTCFLHCCGMGLSLDPQCTASWLSAFASETRSAFQKQVNQREIAQVCVRVFVCICACICTYGYK